ncbi:MAG TPA: PH domain-containing protein [Patescibacteria group bacterium]|jgi:membrane protein YdbS with pleckstrin-like domain|nr:PH domain-containing protein [Patescibacteria group bacterium]
MNIALKDHERIRQIYRQNPFVLIHPVGLSVISIAIITYMMFRFQLTGLFRTVVVAAILLIVLHAIRILILWRMNQYVITNQRILHYLQKGLFDQTVTETPHERILNVSYKNEGLISTMVGFGDVVVQVVGLMDPIVLKNISQPMEIKDYLWEMHKRIAKDMGNAVYGDTDATHVQESVGYTKNNHL